MATHYKGQVELPKTEGIDQCFDWLYLTGALRAALELHLWQKVAAGSDSPEKLADQAGWDKKGAQVLLDATCLLKLMKKEGDRYVLTPESEMYLIPEKPTYKGEMLLNEFHWEADGKLAECIRTGKRPVSYDVTKPNATPLWVADYSQGWVYPESMLEAYDHLWEALGVEGREGLRVLDLACGPSPRSLALARSNPGVRLTWVDWQAILETAMKVAEDLGVGSQVKTIPGDLWQATLEPEAYDLAFLGNVTHFFSPEENIRLFRKVFGALAPSGLIVVRSVVRPESGMIATVDLWLYAASAGGGAYGFKDYQVMLEEVGFIDVTDIEQIPIRARKP